MGPFTQPFGLYDDEGNSYDSDLDPEYIRLSWIKCECGAKHTEFPQLHFRWCPRWTHDQGEKPKTKKED